MDGSTGDHSDSDSGESWTILEGGPSCGDEAPEVAEDVTLEQSKSNLNAEKDEDTDGISVISDSDPESSLPCEIYYDKCLDEEVHSTEPTHTEYISVNPIPTQNCHSNTITNEDDILGDNTVKHKTYVHRRNKRLSTVLNIIMLGSVITAAGVAIGHMWGARNECLNHNMPSINKVLSNLYKLQEENAYLRNKIKELTLASGVNVYQRKANVDKIPFKQQRCRKVYEEPLDSKNVDKITKCIDITPSMDKVSAQPEYEKEFLNDINKLKNMYQQNKSWLDEEVATRMKSEEQSISKMRRTMKTPLTSITEEQQQKLTQEETKEHANPRSENKPLASSGVQNVIPPVEIKSYADSLKADQNSHNIKKRDINNVDMEIDNKYYKRQILKKKNKDNELLFEVRSEEDIKKDDRYAFPKGKLERKKRDRQKLHKKQKRRNKYEQWEMKGGYLKDYDEFSLSSSQDNDFILIKPNKNHFSKDDEMKTYIHQSPDADDNQTKMKGEKSNDKPLPKSKFDKDDTSNWLEKRAALRSEARKKIEREMFGEASSNSAGWYFRRMQRREQCRAKIDNNTNKKFAKRYMNFKTKH